MADKIKADTYFVTECSASFQQLAARRKQVTAFGCRGMTLIELIVVMAVLGVLATMAIPSYEEYMKKARNNVCASDLRIIDKAVTAYYIERNALPGSLNDAGMGSLLDPWKHQYVYTDLTIAGSVPLEDSAGKVLNHDYDLYSKGADDASDPAFGDPANEDDIARARDGAFIGGRP